MPTSIDSLQIDIIAQSNKADVAIDRLVSKLDKLSNSIGKIPSYSIETLANGVDKLGNAMKKIGEIDSRSFTRLVNNINKLSQIDIANINKASSSILRISNSLTEVSTKAEDTKGISTLASSLGKLGGKNVTNAVTNIPLLAKEMNNLLNTLARSPQISRNVIDMTNALANLASKGRSVGTASKSLSNGLNRTHKSMASARTSAFSLAAAFGKLYANYFLVIRGAKAFVNAIKGTSDYIEAFNYYNVAFGKIASEWDKDWEKYGYDNAEVYAESFTKRMQESLSKMSGLEVVIDADGNGLLTSTNLQNLGLNIQEITQYASQLASVTNSVGQTGEVSLAAARSFTKLGADISSLFNIDYSDAMANLQSGLIGQSRALYKYGIDITNATLQTYAFELGLSKSVSEMTQAEKMQLRMVAILDQSKVAWGDLANTINSPSNMLRQFTNNLREVGMVLGQLFIPLMERVMPVVNGATIAIKNFLVNLATLLGVNIDFSAFGQGFTDLGEDADELAGGLDSIASSAKKANAGLRKFDELNNINLPNASGGGGGFASSIDLTDEILKATEEYEKVWNEAFKKMEARSQEFVKKIEEKLQPLKSVIKSIFEGYFFKAGAETSNLVSGIFTFFSESIKRVDWNKIGKNIGDFLAGIDWVKIVKSALRLSLDIGSAIAEVWFGSFNANPIETSIITSIGLLTFTGLGASLSTAMLASLTHTTFFVKFASVGVLIGKSIIGSLIATLGGFSLGQFIYEKISGEKINMPVIEQFSKIKESFTDGSWKDALRLWGNDISKALKLILQDFGLSIYDWFEETTLGKIYKSIADGSWKDAFALIGEDIKEVFESAISDIWQSIQETIINPFLSFLGVLEESNWIKEESTGKWKGVDKSKLTRQNLPQYSVGGFPEDGLFMANHNELVGQFSNGKTAVANNQQITQGIADAVYPAVYNAIVAGIGNSGIGGSSLRVEGDPRGMFRVFVDEWNNEARRTQNNPVIIYK